MPKTNHRTLIDGVGYKITGGRAKVGGATYNIKNGRTKVANVTYNINFMQPVNNTATAQLYSDGSLVFQWDDWRDPTKTWKASYTGWLTATYKANASFDNRPWNTQRLNIKNVSFNTQGGNKAWFAPANLSYWFYMCNNLTNVNWTGLNTAAAGNMYGIFDYCKVLNANTPIICGSNVKNFSYAYENCFLLRDTPKCGENVTNMRYTYSNCYNITGPAVCGDKVIEFEGAYFFCNRLKGQPAIGPSINTGGMAYYCCDQLDGQAIVPPHLTYTRYMYGYCHNITGTVQCSDAVTNFYGTYAQCYKIKGTFACGNKVTDMCYAYDYCTNVSGAAVFGPNVKEAFCAYRGCTQITNAYFRNCYNATNLRSCFIGKNNSVRLNIYAKGGTNTWNRLMYNNTWSIVGANITWAGDAYCKYNTAYNIYIYNESFNDWQLDTMYWPNKTHMIFTNYTKLTQNGSVPAANYAKITATTSYSDPNEVPWINIRDTLTDFVVEDYSLTVDPQSLAYWFDKCYNLVNWTGTIYVNNLTNIAYFANSCSKLKIPPSMTDTVVNGYSAYAHCTNLYGYPICSSNMVNMTVMYAQCTGLTGQPVCGDRVKDMTGTYAGCTGLTGLPAFGPNVTSAFAAYMGCSNLAATPGASTIYVGANMRDMYQTFMDCNKLCSTALTVNIASQGVANMTNCFLNTGFSQSRPLTLYVPKGSTTNTTAHRANTYGLDSISWTHPQAGLSVNTSRGIQIYWI